MKQNMNEAVSRKQAFSDLQAAFAKAYGTTEQEHTEVALAMATCYAVLNKLHKAGGQAKEGKTSTLAHASWAQYAIIDALRVDLRRADRALQALKAWDEETGGLAYDKSGYLVPHFAQGRGKVVGQRAGKPTLHYTGGKDYNAVLHTLDGEGLALLSVACIALEEETQAQLARGEEVNPAAPYKRKKLSRKVYIQDDPSSLQWEEEETSPIRETFRAVRRYIQAQKGVTACINGFSYLCKEAAAESGRLETYYVRMAKYLDVGSHGSKLYQDGRPGDLYTASEAEAEAMEKAVESLVEGMTPRQAQVLRYLLQGYGQKAIATRLGVKRESVKAVIDTIRRKPALHALAEKYKESNPALYATTIKYCKD